MMEKDIPFPVSKRRKRSPSYIPLTSEDSQKFKEVCLERTNDALKTADKIPKNVIGMVDFNSSILLGTTLQGHSFLAPTGAIEEVIL